MFKRVKDKIWGEYVVPRILKRGWRSARFVPLEPAHLRTNFGYDDEAEIKVAIAKVMGSSMSSFERMASLWQQVRYLDRYRIEGAFVECGVWRGGSVGIMALAHLAAAQKPSRAIHLFDSFEGLPEPDREFDGKKAIEYSNHRVSGALAPIGKCEGSIEDNKALLEGRLHYPSELLNYHVGWFQNTLPKDAPKLGPIALLRLDGDWYESTKICLEYLYSKVVPGGVVVIDDYGHWEGCHRAVDEFIVKLGEPILLNHIDYTGRYWVKLR